MIKRRASAHWDGDLKAGKGTISTQSGALKDQPYGFGTRFGDTPGTNPEELIGAAHAACFSMAFANMLAQAGIGGVSVDTKAEIAMDKVGEGFKVLKSTLTTTVKSEGDAAKVREIADQAKAGCPISQLLNCEIVLDLTVA